MRLQYLLAGAAGIAMSAQAQQAPRTVQQDFDAASALTDNEAALAAWQALAKRIGNNKRSRSIILVRESAILLKLDRKDEAVAAAREGLAGLPAGDASLQEDRFNAYFNLGRTAENALDYASAADAYRQAESLAETPTEKVSALLGLATTQTYTDPPAAAAALDRADTVLAGVKVAKNVEAAFARARGLVLLNNGDFAGARKQSLRAVSLLGGLTDQTDLRDVSARSDVAIAALLVGDSETARQYMARTGAGRLIKGSFDPGVQMQAPDCGGEDGLKPADMAVVEFSIGDDGAVILAAPVYAAGGGAVALEFARAVKRWSWTPDQVKQLPTFFRYNARIEMRCSTAFQRPSVNDLLDAALESWLTEQGVTVPDKPDDSDAQALPAQRVALTAAEAKDKGAGLQTLAAIHALLGNRILPREEANALALRALAIADAKDAPPLARLWIDLIVLQSQSTEYWRGKDYERSMQALLAKPVYTNAPRARGAARLLYADGEQRSHRALARTLLQQVADDTALKPSDPIHVGALIRIASLDQQAGDPAAARVAFEKSGLSADQCAIIDSPPKLVHATGKYPDEAARWGFEGWTLTQFDIDAAGKVVNNRAILSYPPFIFSKAGVATMADARYAKSYRPDGGLGCGASTQRVRFALPYK